MSNNEFCPITGMACGHPKSCLVAEVTDNKVVNLRLCGRCAKPYFNDQIVVPDDERSEGPEDQELLRMMLDILQMNAAGQQRQQERTDPEKPPCPACGATLDTIGREGHLGCLDCFRHFGGDALAPVLKPKEFERHSDEGSIGAKTLDEFFSQANFRLAKAVREEDFETASALREKLKILSLVRKEKDRLEQSLSEAVQNGQFEAAKSIKESIDRLVAKFLAEH